MNSVPRYFGSYRWRREGRRPWGRRRPRWRRPPSLAQAAVGAVGAVHTIRELSAGATVVAHVLVRAVPARLCAD